MAPDRHGATPGIDRFKAAQDAPHGGFGSALGEIRAGGKRGHWIWYVFPQISGLGASATSQYYAIEDEREAAAYLRDPDLRARLLIITSAVAEQLTAREPVPLARLMGSGIDALKLVSSLTLFGAVARKLHAAEGLEELKSISDVADQVLAIAAAQGYPPCQHTLGRLRGTG
jgi:uncharacterized protein (DUF1810 family)